MKNKGLSEEEFTSMLTKKRADFFKIAYSYMRNTEDALDVVQDAVCKAYVKLDSVREPEYASTWFTRILINTAITKLKKRVKDQKYLENVEPTFETEHLEEKWDLENMLETLKPSQRDIIILKFHCDYTFVEMGKILKKSENTIKSEFYRALKTLKGKLGEAYEI